MAQQAAALVQIGQLLTKSGLLSHEQLVEALIRSKERSLPIGTVLLTMGAIRHNELRAAVEAQSFVNDRVVTSDLAVEALLRAAGADKPFEQALRELGWQPAQQTPATNRLGELLIDAGLLTELQLQECLGTARETGMPLGRVLIFKRALSDDTLLAALTAQRMVREGTVPRAIAVEGLKLVKQRKLSLEESLNQGGFLKSKPKKTTPVGYLLVEAGFLKEVSLMVCVELSLADGRSVLDSLVEQGFVSRALAQACPYIQNIVESEALDKRGAAAALRFVETNGYSPARAVAAATMPELSTRTKQLLEELIILCGVVEPKEMPRLDQEPYSDFEALQAKLAADGKIESHMIDAVVRAVGLVQNKLLLVEDAVMALHYCRKNSTSLDEALSVMGWKAPAARKI